MFYLRTVVEAEPTILGNCFYGADSEVLQLQTTEPMLLVGFEFQASLHV